MKEDIREMLSSGHDKITTVMNSAAVVANIRSVKDQVKLNSTWSEEELGFIIVGVLQGTPYSVSNHKKLSEQKRHWQLLWDKM